MKPAPFRYERPDSLDAAIGLLAQTPNAKVIAGGQSLGPFLNLRVVAPELLVDISRLEELRGIEERSDEIVVGAATRHVEFEDGRVPSPIEGLFPRIASDIAYRAVRNRGTLGGSLAHADPAADWPAVMVALGATLLIRSSAGSRKLDVSDLSAAALETCLAYDEVIEAVCIPRFPKGTRIGRYKINKKPGDFAQAAAIVIDDRERRAVRVVISGGSLLPTILPRVNEAIAARPRGDGDAIGLAIDADLSALELASYETRLFKVSILRSTREVLEL